LKSGLGKAIVTAVCVARYQRMKCVGVHLSSMCLTHPVSSVAWQNVVVTVIMHGRSCIVLRLTWNDLDR